MYEPPHSAMILISMKYFPAIFLPLLLVFFVSAANSQDVKSVTSEISQRTEITGLRLGGAPSDFVILSFRISELERGLEKETVVGKALMAKDELDKCKDDLRKLKEQVRDWLGEDLMGIPHAKAYFSLWLNLELLTFKHISLTKIYPGAKKEIEEGDAMVIEVQRELESIAGFDFDEERYSKLRKKYFAWKGHELFKQSP
jgi:hypothetical protein